MKTKLLGLIVCVSLLGMSQAGATTYTVSDTLGSVGVTGFIQTDGTLGPLATANITDFNLLLNNGTSTFDLTGPLSGNNSVFFVVGNDLTATLSGLFYNFSNTNFSYVIFFDGAYLCLDNANGQCSANASALTIYLDGFFPMTRAAGDNQIASVSTTPLPSTWLMLLSGFVGLGFFAYRGMKKHPVATAVA
jgi:hypothetical protein